MLNGGVYNGAQFPL
jgi:hypothetical protein